MSTFSGFLDEIPGISIDRFEAPNLQSKVFFLSHCHTDHMKGLHANLDLPGPLYLSNVSAVVIRAMYPNISRIICLNVNEAPTLITLNINNQEIRFTVRFIPAIHCPGSIMFLFEMQMNNLKVLYTGDFRFQLKYVKKLAALKDADTGIPITLDALYLDTTFFDKEFMDFPTQFQSNEAICDLIDEWIKKGPEYVIVIRASARYGSECLFQNIHKRTRLKIHVFGNEFDKYRYFPEFDDCFTLNKNSRIHACFSHADRNSSFLSCQWNKNSKFIRIIKPSAFIWKNWKLTDPIAKKDEEKPHQEFYRACYSNHSSFNEIRDFILYLKPKKVHFNTEPEKPDKLMEYQRELKNIMNIYTKADANKSFNDEKACSTSTIPISMEPIEFSNIEFKQSPKKSLNVRKIAVEDGEIVPPFQSNIIKKRKKQCHDMDK